MKCILVSITMLFVVLATSCRSQRMVEHVEDVTNLEVHKDQFIGRPLKFLLDQVGPQIKSVIGNPETISNEQAATMSFFFDWVVKGGRQ